MSDAATPWFVDFSDVWLAYNEELLQNNQFAVEAIDLKVRKGEFIAIVGPSGCGKSTFMKLATGLKMPSMGKILIDGQPVTGPLKISGMAFQALVAAALAHDGGQRAAAAGNRRALPQQLQAKAQGIRGTRPQAAAEGRPGRLRGQVPLAALGRHAAARQHLPRADPRAQDAAARRALRRARCLHPRGAVVHPARPLDRAAVQRDPGHARPARIGVPGRHGVRDDQEPGALRGAAARSTCRVRATWRSPTRPSSPTSCTTCAATSARCARPAQPSISKAGTAS